LKDANGQTSVAIDPSRELSLDVRLGRLSVAIRKSDGTVATGQYVALYRQKADAAGNPILGDRVAEGRTDNTGIWIADITAGMYALELDQRRIFGIGIEAGKVAELPL
jgi:hypothetical protein